MTLAKIDLSSLSCDVTYIRSNKIPIVILNIKAISYAHRGIHEKGRKVSKFFECKTLRLIYSFALTEPLKLSRREIRSSTERFRSLHARVTSSAKHAESYSFEARASFIEKYESADKSDVTPRRCAYTADGVG